MRIGILGGGISGLSCAWLLKQAGIESVIFESRDYVGGLARSFKWHGFDCDFSAHRLFALNEKVLGQLLTIVPMARHIRRSQVYWEGKWLNDPINATEIALRFSPILTGKLAWNYLCRPRNLSIKSFNDYVVRHYGRSMNDLVFRPYTERLFGIPGDKIAVQWAKEKIRLSGPLDLLRKGSKTKFSYFYYPVRGGYGSISEALYRDVEHQIRLNCTVKALETTAGRITAIQSERNSQRDYDEFDFVISTLPLTILGRMLGQVFPLRFRAVVAVYLYVNRSYASRNHWVYFMDRRCTINRMVEFKNMSPVGCPPEYTVLCAEVTAQPLDITERVIQDLEASRFLSRDLILDTMVKRERFAYPVYTRQYQRTVQRAKDYLGQFSNLFFVGRSAEFEHKEIDDNFTSAIRVVEELTRKCSAVHASALKGANIHN